MFVSPFLGFFSAFLAEFLFTDLIGVFGRRPTGLFEPSSFLTVCFRLPLTVLSVNSENNFRRFLTMLFVRCLKGTILL